MCFVGLGIPIFVLNRKKNMVFPGRCGSGYVYVLKEFRCGLIMVSFRKDFLIMPFDLPFSRLDPVGMDINGDVMDTVHGIYHEFRMKIIPFGNGSIYRDIT